MAKPTHISGYKADVTEGCERVLVTLLRGLGPWKESVYLVGGLTPRYLITSRPPEVPHHAGTGDVDVVVDMGLLTDMEAYATLEENLLAMKFERATNKKGNKVSWRWQAQVEGGGTMILEFLADAPQLSGGKVAELPTDSQVTAMNIPHSSMVFDHHETKEITAELLNDGGRTTEIVRHADIVSFTCLKAFAYDQRHEGKDAHDLVYCLEHYTGGLEAVHAAFSRGLEGKHCEVIKDALERIGVRFTDPNPDEAHLRDGPVAVARFEYGDPIDEEDDELRNLRILRQRQAADLIGKFVEPFR